MATRRLLTLVHVSDVHIGDIDPVTGDAKISAIAAKVFAQISWFDGVLGHHGRALQDLEEFCWRVGEDGPFHLLVSGDITRCGAQSEFDTAEAFLSSEIDLTPPHENHCGLGQPNWRELAIPGNHDHWSGTAWPLGKPTAGLAQWFSRGSVPYARNVLLANGRTLQICGINTDADVSPVGVKRFLASGSFQNQLAALAPMLAAKPSDLIRILVMHHSWHKTGLILSIDASSRAALEKFLESHQFQLVLTGHTHDALLQAFQVGAATVLECRCGTTAQHDQVPYAWISFPGGFPVRSWPQNSLMVHRIDEEMGRTVWSTEIFARTQDRGFQSIGYSGKKSIPI
jgi:hypothetical protein